MTRHITDPDLAYERADMFLKHLEAVKAPGYLGYAGQWGSSAAKTVGSLGLKVGSTGSGIISGGTQAVKWGATFLQFGGVLGHAAAIMGPAAIPLTVVNAAYHAKAVYSTAWHVTCLKALRKSATDNMRGWKTTERVLEVLDYIIRQKTEKAVRRSASAVPGVGILGTVYSIGRNAYKSYKGTKGKARAQAAGSIVDRIIVDDVLAAAVAIEIVGPEDLVYAIGANVDGVIDYAWAPKLKVVVAEKMRST